MITAVVYGRENCGLCQNAAEKLARLNIPYTKQNIDAYTEAHDGWREDDSVEVMTAMCRQNQHIPVIKLDLGDGNVKFTSYVDAMSVLKDRLGRKPQAAEA
ncbi:MAG: glutaredoxin family protein [Planctomycetes bacterium]|nr:glutaredoxin family protein [Planctomycetota bacterium]